jgi:hypothetical protein
LGRRQLIKRRHISAVEWLCNRSHGRLSNRIDGQHRYHRRHDERQPDRRHNKLEQHLFRVEHRVKLDHLVGGGDDGALAARLPDV